MRAHRSSIASPALLALSALILLGVWLGPSRARAYEDQWSLDLGVGAGFVLTDSPLPLFGLPRVSAGFTFGIDDTWAIRADLAYAFHPALEIDELDMHLMTAGVEGLYLVDLLEFVPFLGLGVDLLPSLQADTWTVDFAAHLVLGLDYLPDRAVAIGVDLRPYFLFTSFDLNPVYLSVTLRVSLLFDYL